MSKVSQSAQKAKEMLISFRDKINPLIEKYFQEEISKTKAKYPDASLKALEAYKDVTFRGGKRGRAAFAYYVYKMYGGKSDHEALRMGIVLELTHAYLLLLDDFMDKSRMRRFGPTAHIMMKNYFLEKNFVGGDPLHFGNSIAVTAGAMGFHMAMQLLMDLKFKPSILKSLSDNLNQKIEVTAQGQITDIVNGFNPNVAEADILKMLEWKTGVYTYENPIHTGAIMAGYGSSEELQKLSEYAIPAGIAFQIQDDILGIFGNSDDTGKSVYDDLREGKYTLLIHHALEVGSQSQKEVLKKHLGNPNVGDKELSDVKAILLESGSLDYSKKIANELVLKAKNSLIKNKSTNWKQEGFDYLVGIADYMIERKL